MNYYRISVFDPEKEEILWRGHKITRWPTWFKTTEELDAAALLELGLAVKPYTEETMPKQNIKGDEIVPIKLGEL